MIAFCQQHIEFKHVMDTLFTIWFFWNTTIRFFFICNLTFNLQIASTSITVPEQMCKNQGTFTLRFNS